MKMKISDKVLSLGFNDLVILHLHKRTKLRDFEIKEVDFSHRQVQNGKTTNTCLVLEINNDRRREYTLNVSDQKLTKIKRDLIINEILKDDLIL